MYDLVCLWYMYILCVDMSLVWTTLNMCFIYSLFQLCGMSVSCEQSRYMYSSKYICIAQVHLHWVSTQVLCKYTCTGWVRMHCCND